MTLYQQNKGENKGENKGGDSDINNSGAQVEQDSCLEIDRSHTWEISGQCVDAIDQSREIAEA